MILTCICVDDEPLALGLISSFINKTPFLTLAGAYGSALQALDGIHKNKADLLFLDIQMPDLSGMELARVLNQLAPSLRPKIIFTTAYNHFALEGYKVDALDYLLKPFNYEEFLRASQKAFAYYELIHSPTAVPSLITTPDPDFIFLKAEYKMVKVSFSDILYIEGLKDYVKVMLQSTPKPLLSLTSLKVLEQKLPANKFMRVHRSFMVSLEKIQSLSRNTITIGQATIPVGDQYREAFNQFIEGRT